MFAKLFAFVLTLIVAISSVESRPYHDASISGSLLSAWGGNLDNSYKNQYQAPTYTNNVRFAYPYYYNWQK
ncbi:unnamed protein product [Bursaphelenchus okinawaensis]|uniref:Uncharacterized protein n=1 Tax=Bursaphelenchus okinawaensis TaxID=465554 RepID=A0A811LQA0_9BILA|nr:unnamed protein product [Bursaphelenchus okinawaensis]CAG9127279.1 unnamed protein product [Bursaphelenchus okinawaensis]